MDMLRGCRIVVIPPIQIKVKRSWKERLFSFTLWVSHRVELHEMMDKDIIFDFGKCEAYMRMDTKLALEKAIEAKRLESKVGE